MYISVASQMSTSLCTLFMINAFVRVKNGSAPLESTIVSSAEIFPAERIDDNPSSPTNLYCVPRVTNFDTQFISQRPVVDNYNLAIADSTDSRAQESPNIFYYCTIVIRYFNLNIIVLSLLLCIHILSISV